MIKVKSLHERADERAKEDDRRWFKRHRNRRFRIRNLVPHEIRGNVESFPGVARQVVVAQIAPGVRMRELVCSVFFDAEGGVLPHGDNDEELRCVFEEQLTPQRMAEYQAARFLYGGVKC